MKKYFWGVLYGAALLGFTAYLLMDTFVITRVYEFVSEGPEQTQMTEVSQVPVIVTEDRYEDANISITLTEHRVEGTDIYVAHVKLASAKLLKTAFAQGIYGRNVTEKTSVIASQSQAILAVNGDFYGSQESGFVLRNGVVYRTRASDREALVIGEDGSFSVVRERDVSLEELKDKGAWHVLSFGPALVIDGQTAVTDEEEVGKAMASNPRTAIGVLGPLEYLIVVSDGRTEESEGLSLRELADFMASMGAVTAYNLDGGGSATMVFNGRVINKPTTSGRTIKERSVSDIVYIGY